MRDQTIKEFVDWYINNVEGKSSSYFSNYFKSDKERFVSKLTEYGEVFAETYKFNPFEVEFSSQFISQIYVVLKNDLLEPFKEYNTKNQNGGSRALLGNRNYLRFLSEKMENNILLESEFCDFINVFSSKTQKDYLNYVKNANKILDYNLFLLISDIITTNDFEKLESLRIEGSLLIKRSESPSKKSYSSGFNKYIDFIEEYISTLENDSEVAEEELSIFRIGVRDRA